MGGPLDQEQPAENAMLQAIAGVMGEAIGEAVKHWRDSDSDDPEDLFNAAVFHATLAGVEVARRTGWATLRAVARTAEEATPIGRGTEFGQGYRTAMEHMRMVAGIDREAAVLEHMPDVLTMLATVTDVMGALPPEVARWLEKIATGQVIDPASWLRHEMAEIHT